MYLAAMADNRILTMHPAGKQGVNIRQDRYEFIKNYILKTIEASGEITFSDLGDKAVEEISSQFDGKVLWYITTVKLDLEARNLIERIPKTSPQLLRFSAS
jgi:uncharacterized protein DUF6958